MRTEMKQAVTWNAKWSLDVFRIRAKVNTFQ